LRLKPLAAALSLASTILTAGACLASASPAAPVHAESPMTLDPLTLGLFGLGLVGLALGRVFRRRS
jgi:hypothetical protein